MRSSRLDLQCYTDSKKKQNDCAAVVVRIIYENEESIHGRVIVHKIALLVCLAINLLLRESLVNE